MLTLKFFFLVVLPQVNLSFWEDVEVKHQINLLVLLGKMKPIMLKYAYRVTFPVKKDGSHMFSCGDYYPLNQQTQRNVFPILLVDDVLIQLARS